MRRAIAPVTHAHRHGGEKTRPLTAASLRKIAVKGRGGRYLRHPWQLDVGYRFVIGVLEVRILPRGAF